MPPRTPGQERIPPRPLMRANEVHSLLIVYNWTDCLPCPYLLLALCDLAMDNYPAGNLCLSITRIFISRLLSFLHLGTLPYGWYYKTMHTFMSFERSNERTYLPRLVTPHGCGLNGLDTSEVSSCYPKYTVRPMRLISHEPMESPPVICTSDVWNDWHYKGFPDLHFFSFLSLFRYLLLCFAFRLSMLCAS